MLKRYIALLMAVLLIFSINVNAFAYEKEDVTEDYSAYMRFTTSGKSKGISSCIVGNKSAGATGNASTVTRGDVECWEIKPNASEGYVYFDFDDTMGSSAKDGSVYEFELDYYDYGEGYLVCWYDSVDYGKQIAVKIYTNNSKAWKTATFTIDDAGFENKISGYDFMLSTIEQGYTLASSPVNIYIKELRVKRYAAKQPILCEAYTENVGNTFSHYIDEKPVQMTFTNTLNEKSELKATYRLVSDSGFEVWKKEDTVALEAKETKSFTVNLDTKICAVYTLYIDIKDEEHGLDYTITEDTVCIVPTDEEGRGCEGVFTCWHPWAIGSYDKKIEVGKLMKMANFGGIRGGGYDSWEAERDIGLERLTQVFGFPDEYYETSPGTYYYFPITEKELKGFGEFVTDIAKTMLAQGWHKYEIWNEPNLVGEAFNRLSQNVRDFTVMQKVAYESIKAVDPDAEISGLSICEIGNPTVYKEWYCDALDAGIGDYMTALSIHPYSMQYRPEEREIYKDIIKYKEKAKEYGIDDLTVWNTEYSHTATDVSEFNKAMWTVRDTLLYRLYDAGDLNIPYNFEQKGILEIDREDNFGLVSIPYGDYNTEGKYAIPTMSYVALAAMNYMLIGADNGEVMDIDNNIRIGKMHSDKFQKNMLAVWAAYENENVALDLGVKSVDIYDCYANKKTLFSEDGTYTLALDERVTYLVGDFDDVKACESKIAYGENSLVSTNGNNVSLTVKSEYDDIDIEIEPYVGAELIETTDTDGGKCFEIKCEGEVGKVKYIGVDISRNGKPIHTSTLPVNIVVPAELSLSFRPTSSENYDLWEGKITVSNNLNNKVEQGYLEFIEPSNFASLGKINLGYIPKSSTVEATFEAPYIKNKGMFTLKYNVVFTGGNSYQKEELVDFTMATYAEHKPTIDGTESLNEWPTNTVMVADKEEYVKQIKGWRGVKDLSADVRVMWDEEKLYFISNVTDDVMRNQAKDIQGSWEGDGIQLGIYFIDNDQYVAAGQGGTNFHEFCIAKLDNGEIGTYRTKVQDTVNMSPGMCETAQTAVVRNGNVTTYEWSMPWKDILGNGDQKFEPKEGERIGFSILWNDDDGEGRRGWIEYAGGIGETKNTALFTYLNLLR